ncbi:MAG: hypothetical protein C4345_15590, partial [Chloroflexota bacterium]
MTYHDVIARCHDICWHNIPPELRKLKRWAVYRVEPDEKGRSTKVPYIPPTKMGEPLRHAKADSPETWSKFSDVLRTIKVFTEYGFTAPLFAIDGSDNILAIDVDFKKSPEEGEMPQEVNEIYELFAGKTYIEVSPSKKGLHILLRGRLPAVRNIKASISPHVEVEIFCRNHFVSMTGWMLGDVKEINECQEELDALLSRLQVLRDASEPQRALREGNLSDTSVAEQKFTEPEIVEIARKIKGGDFGEKVKSLFEGKWEGLYPSWSEADLALCSILARHTRGNRDAIDALFRLSALYRPKWDERHSADGRTYGELTLEKALAAHWQSAGEGESEGESNESKSEGKSESKNESRDTAADALIPVGFVVPEGYAVEPDGLYRVSAEGKDSIPICRNVVYVAERLFLEETNEEKWRLRWKALDGKWCSYIVSPSVCLAARNISALGDLGLLVREGVAKLLAQYFYDFVDANADTIPTRQLYTHFGWVESGGQRKFVLDPNQVFEGEESGLKACGDFEEWRAQVGEWRQRFPIARFVLAAGFAT